MGLFPKFLHALLGQSGDFNLPQRDRESCSLATGEQDISTVGGYRVKITGIKTYMSNCSRDGGAARRSGAERRGSSFKTWLFLKVETDSDIFGWGEGSGEWLSPLVQKTLLDWEPLLVGRDPTDIGVLWEDVQSRFPWKGGPVFGSAVAAIDMALHDITGKAWGVPVYKLLGGRRRDRIKVYDGGISFGGTPDEAQAAARAAIERGSRGLKGNPLEGRSWPMDGQELDRSAEIFHAVREEVGDSIELMLDCHGSPTPELAIAFAGLVAASRPLFLEEPCKVGSIEALAQISQRSPVPIATGEKLFTLRQFRELIDRRACAFLQPDVAHCFGITGLMHIARAAAEEQMLMAPHGGIGPIVLSAYMHADAAMENFLIQEGSTAWQAGCFDDLVDHDWVLADGHIGLSDRPGLGIDIREDAVAKMPYDEVMAFRQYRHSDGSWSGW